MLKRLTRVPLVRVAHLRFFSQRRDTGKEFDDLLNKKMTDEEKAEAQRLREERAEQKVKEKEERA